LLFQRGKKICISSTIGKSEDDGSFFLVRAGSILGVTSTLYGQVYSKKDWGPVVRLHETFNTSVRVCKGTY